MADSFEYLASMNRDLLEQFRDMPNSNVLIQAISRQLQEVYQFYVDLQIKRNLMAAEGKQLDGIGDIVVMSREDAAVLANKYDAGKVMDDALYRRYLEYKIFRNTNTCTYPDIAKVLRMFWTGFPILYNEKPEYPATILFNTPMLSPDDVISGLLQVPFILFKAAGVTIRFRINRQLDPMNAFIGTAYSKHSRVTHRLTQRGMNGETGLFIGATGSRSRRYEHTISFAGAETQGNAPMLAGIGLFIKRKVTRRTSIVQRTETALAYGAATAPIEGGTSSLERRDAAAERRTSARTALAFSAAAVSLGSATVREAI